MAAERLAAVLWICAGVLFLATEAIAASAFSPGYSYAHNYISDLGVPICGSIYDGRAICSPLHGLMNADFVLQGLLFFGAALAITRRLSTRTRYIFIALASLNGVGNILLGLFPEDAPAYLFGGLTYHVVGALLAILCGNGTALMSAWTFRALELAKIHRRASIVLPVLAALAFAMLAAGSPGLIPDGIWERISVYPITAWELFSGLCILVRMRRQQRPSSS